MGALFGILTVAAFFVGMVVGNSDGADYMRDKVVVYCIEKPELCKEEYKNIKTQNKLNTYQKPEIK